MVWRLFVLDENKRLVGAEIYGIDAADLVNLLVFIINQRMTAQDLNQSNGVTVEVPETIESAVALEYSFVEALAKLNINVTGIADDNDEKNIDASIKDSISNYISVGTRLEPDTEVIKNAEPQLILEDITKVEE